MEVRVFRDCKNCQGSAWMGWKITDACEMSKF